MIGIELLMTDRHRSLGPADWQSARNSLQNGITRRIAEQNQVAAGDIRVGDVRVVLDDCITSKVSAPLLDGVFEFLGSPLLHRRAARFAGWADHDERVHKGVIDWPLKIPPFAEPF